MKYSYRDIARAKELTDDETGLIRKDWGGKIPVGLVFPNSYQVGMSTLAVHTLYRLFNQEPDIVCERVFWGYRSPPRGAFPPLSLESQRPLAEFAVLALTVSYELDYFYLVQMLRQAEIPLFSRERDETWPLILAGGPAAYTNPAPLGPLVDAFAIGEAESILPDLLPVLEEALMAPREQGLAQLAGVPGIYVPGVSVEPVSRRWVKDLNEQPAVTQIYTPNTEFGDRGLIEIGRGCVRGCRFCMAGFCYRPLRVMSLETILAVASSVRAQRNKVGLVSAAVSDHPQIDSIAEELTRAGMKLAVSSLRVDPLSRPLLKALAGSGTHTLTIAPEAGSERLRAIINKNQSEENILSAVEAAAEYGFPQLKMYFMIGHPTETEDDFETMLQLVLETRRRFPRNLTITATPYVPKPHTPFQWLAMTPLPVINDRIKRLEKQLQPAGVTVRSDSPDWAAVEAILSRGDERLAEVLAGMRQPNLREWRRSLEKQGLSAQQYLGQRDLNQVLPWSVVDMGVQTHFLQRELRRALDPEEDNRGEAGG